MNQDETSYEAQYVCSDSTHGLGLMDSGLCAEWPSWMATASTSDMNAACYHLLSSKTHDPQQLAQTQFGNPTFTLHRFF